MTENDTSHVKVLIYILLRKVDEGQSCSVDDAKRHIHAGDFFKWLASFGQQYGLGLFDESVAHELNEALERQASGIHRSKIGIDHSGFLYVALLATELLEEFARPDERAG